MEMWQILQIREESIDEYLDDPKNMKPTTAYKFALSEYILYQKMFSTNKE